MVFAASKFATLTATSCSSGDLSKTAAWRSGAYWSANHLWASPSIRHHHSAFDLRNAEVPAEMAEVERTDGP